MVAGMVEMGGANTTTGRIHDAEWKDSHITLLCSNNGATTFPITTSRAIMLNEVLRGECSNTEAGILEGLRLVSLVGAEAMAVRSARLSDTLLI